MNKTKNNVKMNQPTDDPILVIEKPFKNTSYVICGWCKGKKVIQIQDKAQDCPYCQGEGLLCRVAEGTMKLYSSKVFNH